MFWTVTIMVAYNILVGLGTVVTAPWITDVVNILGLILSTYNFHINPSQQYNTGSIR
jgi:hypothetical protein